MQSSSANSTQSHVVTVSELNRLAKEAIEQALPLLWVAGEVSNFMRAASGHCYFSLKDAQAQVRCVLFRHKAQLHDWQPQNGMQIEVRATPSLYELRGEFQLNVETLRRSGLGALYEAFEKLKARLQAEGLFDVARKRRLPPFPRAIGVVTSLRAAALRDVLTTLRRRMPSIAVIVYPTAVQGTGAGARIAQAITTAGARAECNVLLVCRGGGSIEDLRAFNEEVVARAIRACTVPVVSGVGHETDFTIADFAADARAPTPTAAAELVSPNRIELQQTLRHLQQRLSRVTARALERRMQQLDVLTRRLVHPGERISHQLDQLGYLASRLRGAWAHQSESRHWRLQELAHQWHMSRPALPALILEQRTLTQRLRRAMMLRIEARRTEVKSLAAQLAQLNPQAVLERGYSIVRNEHGVVVRDSGQLAIGSDLDVILALGGVRAKVTSRH